MERTTEKRIMLAFESHAPMLQLSRVSEKPQG